MGEPITVQCPACHGQGCAEHLVTREMAQECGEPDRWGEAFTVRCETCGGSGVVYEEDRGGTDS